MIDFCSGISITSMAPQAVLIISARHHCSEDIQPIHGLLMTRFGLSGQVSMSCLQPRVCSKLFRNSLSDAPCVLYDRPVWQHSSCTGSPSCRTCSTKISEIMLTHRGPSYSLSHMYISSLQAPLQTICLASTSCITAPPTVPTLPALKVAEYTFGGPQLLHAQASVVFQVDQVACKLSGELHVLLGQANRGREDQLGHGRRRSQFV